MYLLDIQKWAVRLTSVITATVFSCVVGYPNSLHTQPSPTGGDAFKGRDRRLTGMGRHNSEYENVQKSGHVKRLPRPELTRSIEKALPEDIRLSPKIAVALGQAGVPKREVAAVGDGQGGALCFWEHSLDTHIAILGQRVDADGKLLWNAGVPIVISAGSTADRHRPISVSDGSGGAFVVFGVEYTSGTFAGDVDIWGQRVDGNGNLMWNGKEAIPIFEYSDAHTGLASLVIDGSGGIVVAAEVEYILNVARNWRLVFHRNVKQSVTMLDVRKSRF